MKLRIEQLYDLIDADAKHVAVMAKRNFGVDEGFVERFDAMVAGLNMGELNILAGACLRRRAQLELARREQANDI